MVLADSHGISRVPWYSGTCPTSQYVFAYRTFTVYGRPFQIVRLTCWFLTRRPYGQTGPTTPKCTHFGLGYFRVRSPLLAESLLFSSPGGTEMVHFPPLPSPAYVFSRRYGGITRRGFPHSDIPGSQLICNSPRLIAAYRVLHRLPAPRHSPYALSSLNIGIKTNPEAHCIRATGLAFLPTLTHCVCSLICGSEKTTVCRIFSCQRTSQGTEVL
jgi:hypothetical protein